MADLVAASTSIEKLPPEILKQILSNLDEHELLPCRLVNPKWKLIANEILLEKSSFWNDQFRFVCISKWSTSLHRVGTRFSTPAQITRFISGMKGTPNPFPNGTVIFIPDDNLKKFQLIAFHDNFSKFLKVFNDAIVNLVYFIPGTSEAPPDLSCQFRTILYLKNLKSLVIEKFLDWKSVQFLKSIRSKQLLQNRLEWTNATLPQELQELHVHGWNGVIPILYLFGGNESILKSVSSLEISNAVKGPPTFPPRPGQLTNFPLCQFPNLQKLKVQFPDPDFLKQFQQFQPNCEKRLKEISFYLDFSDGKKGTVELKLKEIFRLLDLHAETLELLHLDFSIEPDSVMDSGLFSPVKYPKLKTIILENSQIERWPLAMDQLMAKLVNLQELKIRLPYLEISPREQFEKVLPLWDLIPATVKVITLLNHRWRIKRGEALAEETD